MCIMCVGILILIECQMGKINDILLCCTSRFRKRLYNSQSLLYMIYDTIILQRCGVYENQ